MKLSPEEAEEQLGMCSAIHIRSSSATGVILISGTGTCCFLLAPHRGAGSQSAHAHAVPRSARSSLTSILRLQPRKISPLFRYLPFGGAAAKQLEQRTRGPAGASDVCGRSRLGLRAEQLCARRWQGEF